MVLWTTWWWPTCRAETCSCILRSVAYYLVILIDKLLCFDCMHMWLHTKFYTLYYLSMLLIKECIQVLHMIIRTDRHYFPIEHSNERYTVFFDDRIISKALWPPRSPDLSPPDFFLWGALNGKAYANKPCTIQELETTFDVKLLRLVRTSWRPLLQTWSIAFSSAWTVVANISSISSSINMLLMKQGM